MTDLDPASLASAEPSELATMIKAASQDQLESLMTGEHRAKVLDEIFSRYPSRFRPDKAGSTSAVIHWHITGRADGGTDTYEVVIADGACTLSSAPAAEPKVAVTLDGPNFLRLISGAANPMTMFMTGKLKAKGDLGLAANLGSLFGVPGS